MGKKKEVKTDFWVNDLLKSADIHLEAQGAGDKELDKALQSASKKGTGKAGRPEFCGVVKDFVLVIEDKADINFHIKRDEKGLISGKQEDIMAYAVNGALWYAKHIIQNQNTYKKVFAIAVSGDEKRHRITPLFIDDGALIREPLEDIESFVLFNEKNIEDFYNREILKQIPKQEKTKDELEKIAATLHEDLRNYGAIDNKTKPLIVAGILLALKRMKEKKNL